MSRKGRGKKVKPAEDVNITEHHDALSEEWRMYSYKERLATFHNWPFNGDKTATCTAARMAAAGFYLIQHRDDSLTNDHCRCFVCFKELEGFESSDDPWEEHLRKPDCPYIKLNKPEPDTVTAEDVLRLISSRSTAVVTLLGDPLATHAEADIDKELKSLQQIAKTKTKL